MTAIAEPLRCSRLERGAGKSALGSTCVTMCPIINCFTLKFLFAHMPRTIVSNSRSSAAVVQQSTPLAVGFSKRRRCWWCSDKLSRTSCTCVKLTSMCDQPLLWRGVSWLPEEYLTLRNVRRLHAQHAPHEAVSLEGRPAPSLPPALSVRLPPALPPLARAQPVRRYAIDVNRWGAPRCAVRLRPERKPRSAFKPPGPMSKWGKPWSHVYFDRELHYCPSTEPRENVCVT